MATSIINYMPKTTQILYQHLNWEDRYSILKSEIEGNAITLLVTDISMYIFRCYGDGSGYLNFIGGTDNVVYEDLLTYYSFIGKNGEQLRGMTIIKL